MLEADRVLKAIGKPLISLKLLKEQQNIRSSALGLDLAINAIANGAYDEVQTLLEFDADVFQTYLQRQSPYTPEVLETALENTSPDSWIYHVILLGIVFGQEDPQSVLNALLLQNAPEDSPLLIAVSGGDTSEPWRCAAAAAAVHRLGSQSNVDWDERLQRQCGSTLWRLLLRERGTVVTIVSIALIVMVVRYWINGTVPVQHRFTVLDDEVPMPLGGVDCIVIGLAAAVAALLALGLIFVAVRP